MLAFGSIAVGACSGTTPTVGSSPSSAPADASPVTEAVIVARNLEFVPKELTLAPGVPIKLMFQNADAGIPHNLHVKGGGQDVVKSDLVTGPATIDVELGTLQPGGYSFVCDVHAQMTGTINVVAP